MVLALMVCLAGGRVPACYQDVAPELPPNPFQFIFPNWSRYEITDFGLVVCVDPDPACPGVTNASIAGVTIFNYGTADGVGDITGMYICFGCQNSNGSACAPQYTLTYAGVWNVNSKNFPAWTWSIVPDVISFNPCSVFSTGCNCVVQMRTFVDIGPCATPGRTVRLGPGYNPASSPPGGITDDWGCAAPWEDRAYPNDITIVYSFKDLDSTLVAPGDTITYSIYYGKPGTPNVGPIVVTDTLPPWTHYVPGSAIPAPDPAWDPDPGPPLRLRWTINGPVATAGGTTSVITFKASVDWGNGEAFEPGSGDVAAPEGAFLSNRAHASFGGIACPTLGVTTLPVTAISRRFLFWKLADNDMLFSSMAGQPPDEITYSIFVRNSSPMRTWWNCVIWDTVPSQLDPYAAGAGFDDPCSGWTMTPSGCAAASPGRVFAGGRTILTWKLDMPPGATLTVRWKAQVRSSATAGETAINRSSMLAQGRTGVLDGTGSSVWPRSFAHLARIDLPTTYISYVGYGGLSDIKGACPGFMLAFFPLNKKTQFELRGLMYTGAGWATTGGPSASIGCLIGDCLGGFPGNAGPCPVGAIPGGGTPGCKVERTPAIYDPPGLQGVCPAYPAHYIYKLTSNSPVVWQMLTHCTDDNQDSHTYAPATTITCVGMQHYMYRRHNSTAGAGYGDSLALVNTGADPFGSYSGSRTTTVHLFKFDYGSLGWLYQRSYELGAESAAYDLATPLVDEGPWMTASSDAQLVINHGMDIASSLGCCCVQCADNESAFFPTRETGNFTSIPGQPANFYGVCQGLTDQVKVIIGNIGNADASYRVWRYLPDSPVQVGLIPANFTGTSGSWVPVVDEVLPWGLANLNNPRIYSQDSPAFDASSTALFKVELKSGGPIQVLGGVRLYQNYSGGGIFHFTDGQQTGSEFWFNDALTLLDSCGGGNETYCVDVFCPKTGMAVRGLSEDGYSATYTTTGPDQCVSFAALTNPVTKRNYRFFLPNPLQGKVVAEWIQCRVTEKGWTAPFVQTGVHYIITAPQIVFIGVPFWITVTVIEAGATKDDYCGTTSFTSTDPAAQIALAAMDGYNYTWKSSISCAGVPNDDGVHLFMNVLFSRIGVQSIIATDTGDGSITGLAAILVVGADIKLLKEPKLSVAASGDTVQFRICWSNYSSASGFTFVITDAVPVNTNFVPEATAAGLSCGNTKGVTLTVGYSTQTSATPPPPASFVDGNPVAGTRWLRWTVPQAGVNTSGCACFRIQIQ